MPRGSIDKRGDQAYRIRISFPKVMGVNRAPITRTVHGSRKEAEKTLRDMLAEFETTGTVRKTPTNTLGEWLATYMKDIASLRLKAKSMQTNNDIIKLYLPPLDRLLLSQITTPVLQDHYGNLIRKRGLSCRTVGLLHGVVNTALKVACQQGILGVNPATQVSLPKKAAHESVLGPESTPKDLAGGMVSSSFNEATNRVLTPPEGRTFLEALLSHPQGIFFEVQLLSGCRPGEVGGLLWDSVDYERGGIMIRRNLSWLRGDPPWLLTSPKTKKGVRFIPLDATTMNRLKVHQLEQAKMKHFLGDSWKSQLPFVFTNSVGGPVDLGSLKRNVLRPAFKAAGLDPKQFRGAYSLRKSLSQFLLEIGVHMKLTSERMGHSSTIFTQDHYMSSSDRLQREATNQLSELLRPIVEGSSKSP